MNRQEYYRAVKREEQKRQVATEVVAMIEKVRMRMPRVGTRKLYHLLYNELKDMGVGRDRLFAIIRANHLHIVPKRQYHITTNSHHRFRKHKNLLESVPLVRPEQVWVSDITYIGTRVHPMYLSLVTDAYSKKIMGFNVSQSLDACGAVAALKQAIANRKHPEKQLIHHSDRGLQYCCEAYQAILEKYRISCSMTESYDPYQNAVAERVNGILKHEFILGITIQDLELMNKLIEESIDIYNNERPHWSCRMETPTKMHLQNSIKIRTYKKKNSIESKPDAI